MTRDVAPPSPTAITLDDAEEAEAGEVIPQVSFVFLPTAFLIRGPPITVYWPAGEPWIKLRASGL